ncbi:alpha-L-rhamnosidase C-terminal domain-containing protein [Actinoplanes sp. DH11]
MPDARVGWARGSFDSPQGTITVSWRLDGDTMQLDVEVPPGPCLR